MYFTTMMANNFAKMLREQLEMQRIMEANNAVVSSPNSSSSNSGSSEAMRMFRHGGIAAAPLPADYAAAAALLGIGGTPNVPLQQNKTPTMFERQLELLNNYQSLQHLQQYQNGQPEQQHLMGTARPTPAAAAAATVEAKPPDLQHQFSALFQHLFTAQNQQQTKQKCVAAGDSAVAQPQQLLKMCGGTTPKGAPTQPAEPTAAARASCTNFSALSEDIKSAEMDQQSKSMEEEKLLASGKMLFQLPEAIHFDYQQQQMQLVMQQIWQLYGANLDSKASAAVTASIGQQVQAVQQQGPDQVVAKATSNRPIAIAPKSECKQRIPNDRAESQQNVLAAGLSKAYSLASSSCSASTSPTAAEDEDGTNCAAAAATAADEYVDVVGDGAEGRSSQMRQQRKAHIEFYRKLKSLRNRGPSLECQQCGELVANTDACTRSHLHAHCNIALFVCKLCQRGFADQHLVFEHINTEHPTRKGTQCIEDRRDMAQLMQLLTDCFPRVVCKAKDAMQDHFARLLTADSQRAVYSDNNNSAGGDGTLSLRCRLCEADVPADRAMLHAHLNMHPAFRCKKCKFISMSHVEQKVHQRVEHGLDEEASTNSGQQLFCLSSALEVQLDTLRACFPLSHSHAPPSSAEDKCCDSVTTKAPTATTTATTTTSSSRRRKTAAGGGGGSVLPASEESGRIVRPSPPVMSDASERAEWGVHLRIARARVSGGRRLFRETERAFVPKEKFN
uniref:C2H2-type domain-containing protein n=1 Tax=Globodera rostochiensis TaxID=31243 RepID=A0A914GWI9_GLORO